MFALVAAKSATGGRYLQNQAELLKMASEMPPAMQTFDTARTSKEAAEFGVENIIRSRELERLTDPEAAKMRHEMGSRVAELSSMEAIQRSAKDWAMKQGLGSGYSSGVEGTIGRSAMFDAGTEAGRQARLRALALQQGYLAQTPAPIGGLDPASIIAAEQAAKAQNLASMQQFQGNVMQGTQQLNQSTTDWINSNLGQLQKISQSEQESKRNYEQMMLQNAQQNAASANAQQGQMIGAGGAAIGALAGVAIII